MQRKSLVRFIAVGLLAIGSATAFTASPSNADGVRCSGCTAHQKQPSSIASQRAPEIKRRLKDGLVGGLVGGFAPHVMSKRQVKKARNFYQLHTRGWYVVDSKSK